MNTVVTICKIDYISGVAIGYKQKHTTDSLVYKLVTIIKTYYIIYSAALEA